MKLVRSLSRAFARVFTPGRKGKLSRSHLVGMYMSQTNSIEAYTSDFQQTRERRNGKYSHNRERA